MKRICFILFFIPLQISACHRDHIFALHSVKDEIIVYRKNDDTKAVIFIQNMQGMASEGKEFFCSLSEGHYIYQLLKKINRRNPNTIILTDIETDIDGSEFCEPFSDSCCLKLSPELEKDLINRKNCQKKLSVYSQNFRTPTLGFPMKFIEPFMISLDAHVKLKVSKENFCKIASENYLMSQALTVSQYIKEVEALGDYVQKNQEKNLQIKFNSIKKFILTTFKGSKDQETMQSFLVTLLHKNKPSFLKNSFIPWISKLDSFISELVIEAALKQNNCIVMICGLNSNAQNLKEDYLSKNFENVYFMQFLPPMNESKLKVLQKLGRADSEPLNTRELKSLSRIADEVRESMCCSTCLVKPDDGKKFLVCANCKEAHYCSKKCQGEDRKTHQMSCHLSMAFECNACKATTHIRKKFKVCARCKVIHYCSRECQEADWEAHKPSCFPKQKNLNSYLFL
jgi:hypothetical protein